jgi:hypothetical protein
MLEEEKVKDLITKIFWDSDKNISNNLDEYIDHYLQYYNRPHPTHIMVSLTGDSGVSKLILSLTDFDYLNKSTKMVTFTLFDVINTKKFATSCKIVLSDYLSVDYYVKAGYKSHLSETDDHIEITW